jgi:hypothetical protein
MLKPLAKHLGNRLVPDPTGRAKIEDEVKRSIPTEPSGPNAFMGRVVRYVFTAMEPYYSRLTLAAYFDAFGMSIIVGSLAILVELWAAGALGFNLLYAGSATCVGFLLAGVFEVAHSYRILKRPLPHLPEFPG